MNLLLPALYKCQDLEAATPRRKEPTSPRISASTHGPLQGEPGTRSTHKESPRAAAAPPQQGPERQRTRVQPRAGKAPHPPAGSPGRRAEARGPVHLCCQNDPRAKVLRTLSAWCPDRRSAMSFLTRGRRPPWGHPSGSCCLLCGRATPMLPRMPQDRDSQAGRLPDNRPRPQRVGARE